MISDAEFDRHCDDYIAGRITLDQFVKRALDGDYARFMVACTEVLANTAVKGLRH